MKTILFLIVSEIINHGAEYENNNLDAAGKATSTAELELTL